MTCKIATVPFKDQKPGTSGLRKKVVVFQQENYTLNFVQAIMTSIDCANKTIVVGGDGRYYSEEAIEIICKVAAGNKVKKLIIGQNGILSTPAASYLIRSRGADGGILLTASHNPGGPENDFGIKYNSTNGGPANEALTDKIYEISKNLKECFVADIAKIDISEIGVTDFGDFTVEVVNSVDDYVALMKTIFDFDSIKTFLGKSNFKVLFDAMHGGEIFIVKIVTGPYAERIFVKELGLSEESIMNCVPQLNFGGGHPDPNLTYAHELVERVQNEGIDFGAASDGDGDRNMIVGNNVFVNPSDSVAVIAAYSSTIPYFKKSGLKGLARSMPTSASIDRVAKSMKIPIFEVPTGWKFFGNLMDAGKLSICGEESFGTGSDHIREKDGIWAVLAWLSILAYDSSKNPNTSLKSILQNHFKTYGRNYFSRYDYEEVESKGASNMIARLRDLAENPNQIQNVFNGYKLASSDDFCYTDPIDHSVSKNQGLRFIFSDGSRKNQSIKDSGTGSQGATIRIYVEKYSVDNLDMPTEEAVSDLIEIALKLSMLEEYTGRKTPTVIT